MKEINDLNKITEKIIGCAISVHKILGPVLLESAYESALCYELKINDIHFERQKLLPLIYKNEKIGEYFIDVLVDNKVVVELKSVNSIDPIFEAQILTYMKLGCFKIGLLINFNSKSLKDGIKRFIFII